VGELRDLYQQIILDHNRAPRNFKEPEERNREASGNNPICGDRITVFVNVNAGRIEDIGFTGSGCAISRASSSLMTDAVKGKTVEEAIQLFSDFREMVTGVQPKPDREKLGKLAAFGGVREFPARVKCASLPWHTLKAALEDAAGSVTTE